jgi:colicin import membrane protein
MHLLASAGNGPDPLRPQRPAGLGRGAMLALLVHGGLLLALALGVSWRASEPTGATAELWAAVPEAAAPAEVAPPPRPEPPPAPVPRVARPEPKPEPAPSRDAEIATEKARLQKEALERQERERKEALEREKAREREAKAEAEKKRQQALQEEERRKLAEKAEKAEADRLEKLRQDNLKRIQGQAGATGTPAATGSAARDAGPSASYAGRIVARVKPNIVFTDAIVGRPMASVEVRAAADGTIIGRRLIKSSGNKDWDDAVLRALDRTEILPRDTDGRVPSPITIDFTP